LKDHRSAPGKNSNQTGRSEGRGHVCSLKKPEKGRTTGFVQIKEGIRTKKHTTWFTPDVFWERRGGKQSKSGTGIRGAHEESLNKKGKHDCRCLVQKGGLGTK